MTENLRNLLKKQVDYPQELGEGTSPSNKVAFTEKNRLAPFP